MTYNLPQIHLTEPEKRWLNACYESLKKGIEIDQRALKTSLYSKLPKDFDPLKIDHQVLISGSEITLLGIWQIDPTSSLLPKTDRIIHCIKDIILVDYKRNQFFASEISEATGIAIDEVAMILERFLHQLGRFQEKATLLIENGKRIGYESIGIQNQTAFDQYLRYEGLESLINERWEKEQQTRKGVDVYEAIQSNATQFVKATQPISEGTSHPPEIAPWPKESRENGDADSRQQFGPPLVTKLEPPEQVTFYWLYNHVNLKVWATLIASMVAVFLAGVTLGQTTFVRELLGKATPKSTEQSNVSEPPKISSEDLKSRVDQLVQGHNESIKNLYTAIANEEKEAGQKYFSSDQKPHIDAANRLRETLKQENERFEQQLKALKDLER